MSTNVKDLLGKLAVSESSIALARAIELSETADFVRNFV